MGENCIILVSKGPVGLVELRAKMQKNVVGGYHTVNVSSATSVVARECSLEVNDTIGVTLLDAAEESRVEVLLIRGVAITASDNSGVNTLYRSVLNSW